MSGPMFQGPLLCPLTVKHIVYLAAESVMSRDAQDLSPDKHECFKAGRAALDPGAQISSTLTVLATLEVLRMMCTKQSWRYSAGIRQ